MAAPPSSGSAKETAAASDSANYKKVWICFLGNAVSLAFILAMVTCFRNPESTFFRFGPQTDPVIVSVLVDTWGEYLAIVALLVFTKVVETLLQEIGNPLLGFWIYDTRYAVIPGFTLNELNLLANGIWMMQGVRRLLMIVISVTQIDIALIGILISESTSFFAIRHLLKKKEFVPLLSVGDEMV